MKSFRTYNKTLNVFDIDDTLFTTPTKVKLIGKNGTKELTSQEFNLHVLDGDDKFDFSNFRDAHHFRNTAKPMEKMLDLARRIVYNTHERSETILLTARSDFDDKEIFLQTFRDHGFPIDRVYVERAGNLAKYKSGLTANIAKMVVLRKYINSGNYTRIRIFDDSEKNLRSILKLTSMHPKMQIHAYIVRHDGSFERYTTK